GLRSDHDPEARRAGRRQPWPGALLLRFDGRGDDPGARALHLPSDRAPARHVLERPPVPREVARGVALPGRGPVERIHEDLARAASDGVEPTRAARARPARQRGMEAGADRGIGSRTPRVRLRRPLARGRREPRHDHGAGIRARASVRHRGRPRDPALGDRDLDEVPGGWRQALPLEEGALGMRTWRRTGEQSRARSPDAEGYASREDGTRIFYEVYGEGDRTLVFVPPWAVVHSRLWKAQIPYFARRARVIAFDPRGNGRSDRPADVSLYSEE